MKMDQFGKYRMQKELEQDEKRGVQDVTPTKSWKKKINDKKKRDN